MKRTLKANSRVSFKVQGTQFGDIFYTFEYGEERFEENLESAEQYKQAKQLLWDAVNAEVGKQVQETLNQYKK